MARAEASLETQRHRARSAAIGDHGMIGDLHTAALVAGDGTIDWYCHPHFDSPTLFASLLDAERGGHFVLQPAEPFTWRQMYYPETNVLLTRMVAPRGIVEVTDFMPVSSTPSEGGRHRLVRCAQAVLGEVPMRMECQPRFEYGRREPHLEVREAGAVFKGPELYMGLASHVPLEPGDGAAAEFTVRAGEAQTFVFQELVDPDDVGAARLDAKEWRALFDGTVGYWRGWASGCAYRGRWRERVVRSALALKLLVYEPTGAMVAAPTFGLPEEPGGERNWDYRYCWLRDSSYVIYAFLRLGFVREAGRFMEWLAAVLPTYVEKELPVLLTVEGGACPDERDLDHLAGHLDSRPVRIGNRAKEHTQLDLYGALLDAIYLYNKHGSPISYELWSNVTCVLDWVAEHWEADDQSIWETRTKPRPYVFSKMMAWVALDRGLRIMTKRGLPGDRPRWEKARDDAYRWVIEKGWSETKQSFVQRAGHEALDASALVMPLVFFMSPSDPRMLRTVDAVQRELTMDHFVRRYLVEETADGLRGGEGAFTTCTFWLVEALTRAGRLDEARLLLERMLGYANHLGLYSEELGARGESLGNFPQAFTHLAFISAAVNLDRALGEETHGWTSGDGGSPWRAYRGRSR